MTDTELDFRLDDFEPADDASEDAERRIWVGDMTVLSEHHTAPNGSHSYLVVHDGSATWGVPGAPQLIAIKIARDFNDQTYTFETAQHASLAFAQNWLVEQGCPRESVGQVGPEFMKPADLLTVRVEQRVRDSGARYKVLDSSTSDSDPAETWTMASDSQASALPVRVFLEDADFGTQTYTLREGAFADEHAAQDWLDTRDGPLPQPPEYRGDASARRAHVALARSSGLALDPKTIATPAVAPTPAATQLRVPRRSM
ncbi:glycosyl hydrolase [Streptomyces acidiscabies]|uniref:Glycosyl hydrolase n=1 Tax=Streptomyces acidiscabies TaxID=42234 RepID=A0A0L0KL31_9ACTN|nr:glycosyl hydrolase [Streptomyces acidiscabies]